MCVHMEDSAGLHVRDECCRLSLLCNPPTNNPSRQAFIPGGVSQRQQAYERLSPSAPRAKRRGAHLSPAKRRRARRGRPGGEYGARPPIPPSLLRAPLRQGNPALPALQSAAAWSYCSQGAERPGHAAPAPERRGRSARHVGPNPRAAFGENGRRAVSDSNLVPIRDIIRFVDMKRRRTLFPSSSELRNPPPPVCRVLNKPARFRCVK